MPVIPSLSRGRREERHAGGRQHETAEDDGQSAPPPRAGAVRRGAGQGHEQQEQEVVDGHDGPDGRAMIAEGVPHERRHEGAQERSGDAGEEAAQADDQQRTVRDPRRADRPQWCGRHDLGGGTRLHPRARIYAHLILAGRSEPFCSS